MAQIDIADKALAAFSGRIEMPRTELSMEEWFEQVTHFVPHDGQRRVIEAIRGGKHEIDIVAGKRSGKSRLVREIALYYVAGLSKRVWILGPTWDIVDRIFFPLWDQLLHMGLTIVDKGKETRVLRLANGGVLEGVSWRTTEQIEAEGVHVAITDESQYLTPSVADKIRARLVGDWLWIRIGSPSELGISYFEEQALAAESAKMPNVVRVTWPTWVNPDPEVQQTIKIAREDLDYLRNAVGVEHPAYVQRKRYFDAVYGGESVPPSDIAIATFNPEVHVRECPFDPELPVYLGIDPGYYPSYYAVVVVQPHPWGEMQGTSTDRTRKLHELWQVDEIYVQKTITDDVIAMCKERPWWRNVTRAVIDASAGQRQRQTGMSDLAIWQQKAHFPIQAEAVSVDDSLTVHRRWLAQGRLFHDRKCTNTIKEYLLHKMKSQQGAAKDIEVDRWNHAHKALEYLIAVVYGLNDEAAKPIVWRRQVARPSRRVWMPA
jgi:hypothetical protein